MPKGIPKNGTNKGWFKKGFIPWAKGKKPSEETKNKMSKAKKGRKLSKDVRDKMSEAQQGEKHSQWKGGKTISTQGYVLVHSPNHPFKDKRNYVLEHRLVVEGRIGRYLKSSEQCHHLGERDDNRPHMLMAFSSLSTHKKFEGGKTVEQKDVLYDGRKLNKGEICLD